LTGILFFSYEIAIPQTASDFGVFLFCDKKRTNKTIGHWQHAVI